MLKSRAGSVLVCCALLVCCAGLVDAGETAAEAIIKASGVKGGLCVHLGATDGKLTADLSQGGKFVVQGLTTVAENVEKARKYVRSKGLYGKVSVERGNLKKLPYAENLVNLIVAEDLAGLLQKGLSLKEVFRVLTPYGAMCFKGGVDAAKLKAAGFGAVKTSGACTAATKPWPKEMDGWPMVHHGPDGNAVSQDTLIGPATDLRWRANCTWDRPGWYYEYGKAWVSAGGRNFQIMPKLIVARDAFNGIILWTRPITAQFTSIDHNVVATSERLFITLKRGGPLVALDAATGEVLKTYEKAGAPGRGRVVHDKGRLYMCGGAFDVQTGKQLWKVDKGDFMLSDGMLFAGKVNGKFVRVNPADGKTIWSVTFASLPGYSKLNLFLYRGMLIRLKRKARSRKSAHGVECYSAKTGKLAWETPFTGILDHRACGAQGLVWSHEVVAPNPKAKNAGKMPSAWVGRDPATGKTVKRYDDATSDPEVVGLLRSGTHRCGPERFTENYSLAGTYEFFDWKTGKYHVLDGTRSACYIGLYPANGLVYTPMTACSCRSHMPRGSAAMAHRSERIKADDENRLETGPAFGKIRNPKSEIQDSSEWPIYRHDVGRTGSTEEEVPGDLGQLWEVTAASGPTPPTVAGGLVYVASMDEHKVMAFDAETSKLRWSYVAGGPVDTPPTIHSGLAVFGTRDGRVTCLRATDGQLVWRFRAAPIEQRIMVDGRLESAWPVHGSVLVDKNVVRFAAGWHTGLDGGITTYELELLSGKVLKRKHEEKLPLGPIRSDKNRIVKLPIAPYQGRLVNLGRFGFRDSSWHIGKKPRKWVWSDRRVKFPGWRLASKYLVSGKDLTVDLTGVNKTVPRPGHQHFQIKGSVPDPANENKPKTVWGPLPVPVRLRAMILAGSSVVVAGRRNPLFPEEVRKARGGRARAALTAQLPEELRNPKGALLLTYSAADGKKKCEVKLAALPVFDGLAAAGGRVYLSTQDGKLRCFGKK